VRGGARAGTGSAVEAHGHRILLVGRDLVAPPRDDDLATNAPAGPASVAPTSTATKTASGWMSSWSPSTTGEMT
jgi:hypothetical protein